MSETRPINIDNVIRNLGWMRAHRIEEILKCLNMLGINPEHCFLDQNDHLIIPCSELSKGESP